MCEKDCRLASGESLTSHRERLTLRLHSGDYAVKARALWSGVNESVEGKRGKETGRSQG